MLNILTGKWNRNQKNLQNTSCLSDKDPAPYRLSESELKNTCCPHCHKQGTLVYSKSYFRYFFSSAKDIEEDVRISIAVYYCPVCQTYHSLFPEDICPFSHFSYSLIRRIISYFNSHGRLLAHTARKFSISVKTLRHLIAIWNQNIDLFNRLFVESVSFNMTANDLELFFAILWMPVFVRPDQGFLYFSPRREKEEALCRRGTGQWRAESWPS